MGIAERKEREKLQRRNDIIDAAEKVFFSRGFESATMDEIAEMAELSKGTLYLYFKSKEDLQFAIFMRGSDILMKMMKDNLSADSNGYQRLLELANSFIRFSREKRNYFSLFMYYESSRMEALNIDQDQLQIYLKEDSPLALVTHQVIRGIQDGSLRDDLSAEVFSATLWSQMLGVLIVLNNKADLYEIFNLKADEILQTHLELVSKGSIPIK
ncbi:MAG: TetR/AcrR family transcriptional regulator [Bacteroidales bacterium]|nr:TetR/AcrR family transcriptional regulator [Bacteroidales bacterium]